eukprot:GHVL01006642.1.p1 GENE.GHVL01006642.1~~GHVL01006642.1.p1  ORF type:complete len:284 (-),score=53.66 GHVL01006642.1:611-1462(-)
MEYHDTATEQGLNQGTCSDFLVLRSDNGCTDSRTDLNASANEHEFGSDTPSWREKRVVRKFRTAADLQNWRNITPMVLDDATEAFVRETATDASSMESEPIVYAKQLIPNTDREDSVMDDCLLNNVKDPESMQTSPPVNMMTDLIHVQSSSKDSLKSIASVTKLKSSVNIRSPTSIPKLKNLTPVKSPGSTKSLKSSVNSPICKSTVIVSKTRSLTPNSTNKRSQAITRSTSNTRRRDISSLQKTRELKNILKNPSITTQELDEFSVHIDDRFKSPAGTRTNY